MLEQNSCRVGNRSFFKFVIGRMNLCRVARSTRNRAYLMPLNAGTVPYMISIWITAPNLVGRGSGVLGEEDLGMVATSPMSMIFSRLDVEMVKLFCAVVCISFRMLSIFLKPKAFRR